MELREAQEKLKPTEYSEMLRHIELSELFLRTMKCELVSRDVPGSGVALDFKEEMGPAKRIDETFSCDIKYSLSVQSAEQKLFDITATYGLSYELKKDLPEAFFVIFQHYTLPMQTFPYVRELVHSTTSKMGLSNFIMPIRRFLVGVPQAKTVAESVGGG